MLFLVSAPCWAVIARAGAPSRAAANRRRSASARVMVAAAPALPAASPEISAEARAHLQSMQAAWMQWSRKVAQSSEDVGKKFAEEARRIHYGETEERAIRGQTSPREAMELLEEGIAVLPLALPESASGEGGGSLQ